MIPRLNSYGYLPRGIHKASLREIKERFGSGSLRRKQLFKKLQSVVALLLLQKEHIQQFILDGSFVTSKNTPNDFDCVLIVKESFDFSIPAAKKLQLANKLFSAHMFTFTGSDGGTL